MYYRRKILLSLLEVFEGELEKIRLQKLLMLLTKFQKNPSFDFVPYKFGCFSFQANADLSTMTKYKQVESIGNSWLKRDSMSYLKNLKKSDLEALSSLKRAFGRKTSGELIEITYKRYPYYAINSIITDKILGPEDKAKVLKYKNEVTEKALFTIGYEGISLETYLNKLLRNGVRALVDVRRNASSMKYGFNKSQLDNACKGVNIEYYHIPELGIDSNKRKDLNTQEDYNHLFEYYKNYNLKKTSSNQEEVLHLLFKHDRIALTCFEANICQCHRKPLAEAISKLPGFKYQVKHI